MNSSEFSHRRRKYYLESLAREQAAEIARPAPRPVNVRSREVLDQLQPDEIEALRVFSTLYGRNWRTYLRNQWETGFAPAMSDLSPQLQRVRNKIGPSGLCDIRTIDLQPEPPRYCGCGEPLSICDKHPPFRYEYLPEGGGQ